MPGGGDGRAADLVLLADPEAVLQFPALVLDDPRPGRADPETEVVVDVVDEELLAERATLRCPQCPPHRRCPQLRQRRAAHQHAGGDDRVPVGDVRTPVRARLVEAPLHRVPRSGCGDRDTGIGQVRGEALDEVRRQHRVLVEEEDRVGLRRDFAQAPVQRRGEADVAAVAQHSDPGEVGERLGGGRLSGGGVVDHDHLGAGLQRRLDHVRQPPVRMEGRR